MHLIHDGSRSGTSHSGEPGQTAVTAADCQALVAWLSTIGDRLDLSVPAPNHPYARALEGLLAVFSREFTDYRDVVATARDAARRNAEQLRSVVRSTLEQGALIRATAAAARDAGQGAVRMAAAADVLRQYARSAAHCAETAAGCLTAIDTALGELAGRLAQGSAPLGEMRRSTAGVGDFLVTLGRLSRHAQLLAVNASIEAAHLDRAGARFAIVADEVRKLAESTRASRADVARIVGELGAATDQIVAAISDSQTATATASREIAGATEALEQTNDGVGEFASIVGNVADQAANQSRALDAIHTAIDQIDRYAQAAAAASRAAGGLNLDTLLERSHTEVGRWRLRSAAPPSDAPDDDFGAWIAGVAAGTDPGAGDFPADTQRQALAGATRALVARVDADQRTILASVVQAAVAVSRDGYAWQSISQSLHDVRHEIANVRESVGETAAGVRACDELARTMHDLAEGMSVKHDSALELLDGALGRAGRIGDSVHTISGFVESMNAAAARVDEIMTLIETLSSETVLLSLNAALEAAHAGQLGLGFSVIADEIRALAHSTNDSTTSVSQLVSNIARISRALRTSFDAAQAGMTSLISPAATARRAIADMRAAFSAAIERAAEVSTTSAEQAQALEQILAGVDRSDAAVDANELLATDRGRTQLASVGSRAHSIAARRPIGTVAQRVRALTQSLCERLEAVLEDAVARGTVSLDGLFAFDYREIDGADVATLSRLFDVSLVSSDGFDPPKFATPWDAAVDEALIDVLTDGWAQAGAAAFRPVTMFVSDLNGFFYAYPRPLIGPWTNDPARDRAGNRIKRVFDDEYALRVGRWGLGPNVAGIGPRARYEQFRAAGCTLERQEYRPWGGYVYARDTNVVCNEVAMAIYVADRRHSTLRVCYDADLI